MCAEHNIIRYVCKLNDIHTCTSYVSYLNGSAWAVLYTGEKKAKCILPTSLGVMFNCISTRRIISSYDIGIPLSQFVDPPLPQ